jgi:hypothetical protein
MRMRFARGVVLASALGLIMSGGTALAADSATAPESAPAVDVGWSVGKPFPVGATRWDGAVVGKKVYFLGYRDTNNETDGSIWTYNIKKKKYKDTGIDMAVPISNYTVAVLKDKTGEGLYTFGGRDATGLTTDVVQVFYPSTGETKVINSDPWPGTTPTPDNCVSLPATGVAVADNKAYVMGGMSFSTSVPPCQDGVSKEVWAFNPKADNGKRWKKQPSLKVARGYISPTVVGGNKIYAIGGDLNEAGSLVASATVESWKIGADKWSDGPADLPVGCDESQAFAFDGGPLAGTITLAGCGQWPAAVADVYQYDVSGDDWSIVGALNEARRNQAGANIGSQSAPKLFLVGGYSTDGATALSSSEIGTPDSLLGGTVGVPAPAPAPGVRVPVF